MKFSQIGIISILLVVIVVVFAGCTSSAPSAPSVTTPQITSTLTKTTAAPTVATARQPATTVQVTATENPVKVFNGEYRWAEYRNTISVTMPPNPRSSWVYNIKMERSTGKYEGNPAIHDKVTTISDYPECCIDNIVTITKDGRIAVEDTYFDTSTNRFLGGTWAETIKGIVKPVTDLPVNEQFSREDKLGGEMGIMPFGEMNITLTYEGIKTVTVPAGTYSNARKYTGNFHDGTPITFWVAPGIPVPVLYQFPNKSLDGVDPFQSYELKSWG